MYETNAVQVVTNLVEAVAAIQAMRSIINTLVPGIGSIKRRNG